MDDVARQLYPANVINEMVYVCDDDAVQEKANPTVFNYESLPRGNTPNIQNCHVIQPDEPPVNKTPPPVLIPTASTTEPDPTSAFTQDSDTPSTGETSSTTEDVWPGTNPELTEIERANGMHDDESDTPSQNMKDTSSTPTYTPPLRFDSSFESGNLRAAYRVSTFKLQI